VSITDLNTPKMPRYTALSNSGCQNWT